MLDFNHYYIPAHTQQALLDYVEHGYEPGGFLYSVLCNDLIGAVSRADASNLESLRDIAQFVYNEMPSNCHGNEAIVVRYLQDHPARQPKVVE
jgi:hypothetical protein